MSSSGLWLDVWSAAGQTIEVMKLGRGSLTEVVGPWSVSVKVITDHYATYTITLSAMRWRHLPRTLGLPRLSTLTGASGTRTWSQELWLKSLKPSPQHLPCAALTSQFVMVNPINLKGSGDQLRGILGRSVSLVLSLSSFLVTLFTLHPDQTAP